MDNFKFYLITDTHFFKNSIGAYGEAYEEYMDTQQKCFAETEAIDRAWFKYLKESKETDTILIAGDLSFNGEKESHEELVNILHDLKDSGKKIYVVTAGHDFANPFKYPGTERQPAEGITFEMQYDYYHSFGYDDSIAFNKEHLSYVAQLQDGLRLLVICNDISGQHNVEYDDEFYDWIISQCRKAKEDGQVMFAMEHYPVIGGQPILDLIGDARVKNASRLINTLADNGVNLIFTGHMHNQSINLKYSENGNKFYDVCTGSAIGCPCFIRLCEFTDENTIDIKSIPVPDYDWDTKGVSCEQYLQNIFDNMIFKLVNGLADTPEKTLGKIGVKNPSAVVLKLAAKAGKFLRTATLGKICRLLMVKCDPGCKDKPFIDYAVTLVRTIFTGNQPYTDQTPEGRTSLNIFRKIAKILKLLKKEIKDSQGETVDIYEVLKHSAGNYDIDDNNAVLILK